MRTNSPWVRALAISTPKRSPLAPDLPPVSDILPGYTSASAIGFFAPRKTPAAIVTTLNKGIQQALRSLDPKLIATAGVEIVGSSPEAFAQFIKSDMAKMGEVIRSGSFTN